MIQDIKLQWLSSTTSSSNMIIGYALVSENTLKVYATINLYDVDAWRVEFHRPLTHLYNPFADDIHYTTNEKEVEELKDKIKTYISRALNLKAFI